MLKYVLGAALMLAGCATRLPRAPEVIPLHGSTPGFVCRSEGLERFVGQPESAEIAAQIQRESGAKTLRWTRPGMAVTMDFREDRVNVQLDGSPLRIVRITCG